MCICFSESLTDERIEQIRNLSKRADVMDALSHAIGETSIKIWSFSKGPCVQW